MLGVFPKMQGHHDVETKSFAVGFDGQNTKIGDLNFLVTKATIVAVGMLTIVWKHWFKQQNLSISSCNQS